MKKFFSSLCDFIFIRLLDRVFFVFVLTSINILFIGLFMEFGNTGIDTVVASHFLSDNFWGILLITFLISFISLIPELFRTIFSRERVVTE